jgi:hypothetical protein
MPALESLQTAVGALVRTPVLFVAGLAYGLILLPQTATQLLGIPFLPLLLQVATFFVTPFLVAGLIGMADEAIGENTTSLGRLTAVGRERYVPLLLGNLIQFGIVVAFGVVFFVVVLAGGVMALGAGGAAGSAGFGGAAIAIVALVALLLLLFLLVFFFIQFFQVSIVAGERDAVEGFKESVSLVRSNLLATLGYSVINLVVSLLTSAPVTAFVMWRSLQQSGGLPATGSGAQQPMTGVGGSAMTSLFSPAEAVALALVTLAITMVLTTFQQTYATAFYRRHDVTRSQSIEERVLDEDTA